MTAASITIERSDTVVICSLDSPDERNALSATVAEQLVDALDGIEETGARCVLIRGDGDTFCAGGDVSAHVEYVEGEIDRTTWRERMGATAAAIEAVYDCPLPTVAAITGPAFSEGACLALACDLRVASDEGAIGFGFRRFGQAVAAGASYLLPRLVGPDVALELLYTGELLDADRAASLGLFTQTVPSSTFEDELASLLATVSTGPVVAMTAAKRLCRSEYGHLGAAIDAETETLSALASNEAFEEGVTAFVQQRDPQF